MGDERNFSTPCRFFSRSSKLCFLQMMLWWGLCVYKYCGGDCWSVSQPWLREAHLIWRDGTSQAEIDFYFAFLWPLNKDYILFMVVQVCSAHTEWRRHMWKRCQWKSWCLLSLLFIWKEARGCRSDCWPCMYRLLLHQAAWSVVAYVSVHRDLAELSYWERNYS